jgi:hypothetical protein
MKKTPYTTFSDAGHGWMAVPLKDLVELKIADKVSPYSFLRGKTAYLEEDADATLFFETYKNRFGKYPEQKEGKWHERSPIRYYRGYRYDA